jgi:RNA polymerase-interacting CarD/CdnL/TRCF family regulator
MSRQHGVGSVRSIVERSFGGPTAAQYVELYFATEELTVILREDELPGMVREMVSAEQAAELLANLRDWGGSPSQNWQVRARAHAAAIEGGDPFEYLKVVKELHQLDASGTLRRTDQQHYQKSLDLLTEELMFSLGKPKKKVRSLIEKALANSKR